MRNIFGMNFSRALLRRFFVSIFIFAFFFSSAAIFDGLFSNFFLFFFLYVWMVHKISHKCHFHVSGCVVGVLLMLLPNASIVCCVCASLLYCYYLFVFTFFLRQRQIIDRIERMRPLGVECDCVCVAVLFGGYFIV